MKLWKSGIERGAYHATDRSPAPRNLSGGQRRRRRRGADRCRNLHPAPYLLLRQRLGAAVRGLCTTLPTESGDKSPARVAAHGARAYGDSRIRPGIDPIFDRRDQGAAACPE
jgi:hypothetical protein